MYFESILLFELFVGIMFLIIGIIMCVIPSKEAYSSLGIFCIILSCIVIIVCAIAGTTTINYTVTGLVCEKTYLHSYGEIKINDTWYTIPSNNEYLDIDEGSIVIISVVERPTIAGQYKSATLITSQKTNRTKDSCAYGV